VGLWEWYKEHKIGATIGAVILAALISTTIRDDNEPPFAAAVPTTTLAPSGATTTATLGSGTIPTATGPNVPPVDCSRLMAATDVDLALGSEERPFSELSSFRVARGEVCQETLASDDAYFIRLEPGDPADFAPAAVLNGRTGEPVSGVGDEARWFGGPGVPALLAVYQGTTVGDLVFRVSIGRPDLSPEEQLPVVSDLARVMLARFPYVEVEEPEPEVFSFDREPPSTPPQTFDEVVVAGEEAGQWSRGEGLVAALRFLAGAPSEFAPPGELDVLNGSATGVILMAQQYLDDGPDAAARAELEALLSGFGLPQPLTVESVEALGSTDNVVISASVISGEVVAQEAPQGPSCGLEADWYGVDCTVVEDLGGVLFGYPRGALTGTVEGWDLEDISVIRQAIQTTIAEYTKYGTMSKIDLVVTPEGNRLGEGIPKKDEDRCVIYLNKRVQALQQRSQSFFTALELAGCFLFENLPSGVFDSYSAAKWWYQGTTTFLAAEAFPDANSEWSSPITRLEANELETSLQDRSVENWPFFRSVAGHEGGPLAVLTMLSELTDAPLRSAQQDKLTAYNPSNAALHVFHEELTDQQITDASPPGVTYEPVSWEVEMSGPSIIQDEPIRFGVSRYHVSVASGMTACLEYDISDDVVTSWRQGKPGSGAGGWTTALPDEITGDSVFVATTVADGQSFNISAKVSDKPGCGEDEPPEPEDCALCGPSLFYRLVGAVGDAMGS
jgi:hypothetical protein